MERVVTFCRAVASVGAIDGDLLYWAGRASLVGRKEDFAAYDRVFRSYFRGAILEEAVGEASPDGGAGFKVGEISTDAETLAGLADEEAVGEEASVRLVASRSESLRHKAFDELTEAERRLAVAAIRAISMRVPTRPSRRLRPSNSGARFDLRSTLRSSLRTEGEPFRRAWRDRRMRTRPLLLVLDISGSMSAYSRALLQFGFAARRAGQRVEVFCFGTRLTRLTRSLDTADPDRALEAIAAAVADWDGGTRIGDSLQTLLDVWANRVPLRGSLTVICSDGLERGDPELVARQMARLQRLAHRVVWVNPLKGSPEYQPLARGMAAALPHVDVFLAGHNIASLEVLSEVIGHRGHH